VSEIVTSQAGYLDVAYLDTLRNNEVTTRKITILLEGKEIACKMDTGAEVMAISKETYAAIGEPKLSSHEKILYGPSSQQLHVLGKFKGTLSHKNKSVLHPVFVVKDLKTNLLGLPAILSLNLLARMDSFSDIKSRWEMQFPSVFKGLGTLGGRMRYSSSQMPNHFLSIQLDIYLFP
jgi:hypothetical protein